MRTLYRCIAGSLTHERETIVFFEAVEALAHRTAERLLSIAWDVPPSDLDVYNVFSDAELTQHARGSAASGDLRLLEIGEHEGRPLYAPPDRTLTFVTPSVLERVVAAQQRLGEVGA